MESVLKKLNHEGHIVIGSPTGSGKTLMFICAICAYLSKY